MSNITIAGNAAGTATFTVAAPATNTNRTLTLPDETGTVLTNQSAVSSTQIAAALNASGSAPIYACRAWVNFNGIGTVAIRASGNVSSITDNGVGDYTVNFTTAMQDANYALVATVSHNWVDVNSSLRSVVERDTTGARTTSSVRLQALSVNSGSASNPTDTLNVNVAIFR